METIHWKVDGMTCGHCALTVTKFLEGKGQKNVRVNLIGGDVQFELADGTGKENLIHGIEGLGYSVAREEEDEEEKKAKKFLGNNFRRFLFCVPFTLLLMLHMFEKWIPIHWLMNPWVQLIICLPVYVAGMVYFGKSAVKSIRNGMPNMNVLIALGATAAFVYSLTGTVLNLGPRFMFYETTATIITLVFFGNYLEDASVRSTQKALKSLMKSQKVMANMIAFDEDHKELVFPLENTQLKTGDLILVRTGEQVPIDCKIIWGEATVNESIITGESIPVQRKKKDRLIGGSICVDGTVKAQVTAVGEDTVLSHILKMVKQAQAEKPPIQQLADRISAIFVPVVVGLALITLILNWIYIGSFAPALTRCIAVLVIACPCAMGLATPAAIAVGLGRAAKSGILFRNASSLELFRDIRQVVFDKTGTLTTGQFRIENWGISDSILNETDFKKVIYSLEKYSTHPIARSIAAEWKDNDEVRWNRIEEIKGRGIRAKDQQGRTWWAGSLEPNLVRSAPGSHNVYLVRDNVIAGWIDVKDEIRPEAALVVNYLKSRQIKTILLSGDRRENCDQIVQRLGIDEVWAEQSPEQKSERIGALSAAAPTAMVGDGINDAPALAKSTVGISMSDATQLAMQSAQVVLMNNGLKHLPLALGLGRHTYRTIQQNLFWAFFYNIVAIPVAALGFLTPAFGALVMGLSDVVLAINSVRLFVKKVV